MSLKKKLYFAHTVPIWSKVWYIFGISSEKNIKRGPVLEIFISIIYLANNELLNQSILLKRRAFKKIDNM